MVLKHHNKYVKSSSDRSSGVRARVPEGDPCHLEGAGRWKTSPRRVHIVAPIYVNLPKKSENQGVLLLTNAVLNSTN